MISEENLKKLQSEVSYNYHSMVGYIEDKYSINVEQHSFWHWALDNVLGEISNGSTVYVNWKDALDNALVQEKNKKDKPYTKICQLFYNEFGDKDYSVLVSW